MHQHQTLRHALVLAVLLAPACVHPDGVAPATPQQPGFTFSTATTAERTFEIETAVNVDKASINTPSLLKYGATDTLEVFTGWSPYQRNRDDNTTGTGATSLGARWRVLGDPSDGVSVALLGSVKLPRGSKGTGNNDETDYFAGTSVTGVHNEWGWIGYYQFGLLGREEEGGSDVQHGLALAGSRALPSALALSAELAWIQTEAKRDSDDSSVFTTWGLAWARTPSVVWDLAVQVPLNDDAGDTLFTLGLTLNLGRMFGTNAADDNSPSRR